MPVTSLDLARYKRLAIRSTDVWQGGIVRLPAWVQARDEDPPQRVQGAFWLSARTGLVWMTPAGGDRPAPGAALAVEGLAAFAKKHEGELMGRPARIEVTNAALADEMRALLAGTDTTVAVVPDLPNVREAMRSLAQHLGSEDERAMPLDLLATPDVTIDRIKGFADAAARFYRADIWDALDTGDLITIDSPVVDPAMQHVMITGSTRDVRGLTFFASRKQYEKFQTNPPGPGGRKPSIWIVSFDTIDWMPFGDVDAWLDHDLPVAAPDAYPRPGFIDPDRDFTRPNAKQLAFLEAVLRALAETTDDDFDAGRWTRRVETADGPIDVRLSLPYLLEDMASPGTIESVGDDAAPLARAQTLAWEAMTVQGRRQIQLARQALAISRDCADAWSMLAERTSDSKKALTLLHEAVAAGERALGPDPFAHEVGHFWGILETRPYMRARAALAQELEAGGAIDDAVGHYRELLRLNPGDNQGVRYTLLACLLEARRDTDAAGLLDQFAEDDTGPSWLYAAALLEFRAHGDSAAARERLHRALAANAHVVPILTGERELPRLPESYARGSIDEAAISADLLLDAWNETPGAVFWLNTMRREMKAMKAKKGPGGRKRGR